MKALFFWPGIVVGGAVFVLSCGGDDNPPVSPAACVENLQVDCGAVFVDPPTYANIYSTFIQKQCAIGSSCHTADVAMGGLGFGSADDTYHTLLGDKGGKKYVVPNDPACSPLMVRLESRDNKFVMPQGARMTEPELCDFVKWIAEGAKQN